MHEKNLCLRHYVVPFIFLELCSQDKNYIRNQVIYYEVAMIHLRNNESQTSEIVRIGITQR